LVLLVVAAFSLGAFYASGRHSPGAGLQAASPEPAISSQEFIQKGFSKIAETVRPSVVRVEVEEKVSAPVSATPRFRVVPREAPRDPLEEWFRQFFGTPVPSPFRFREEQQPRDELRRGEGSGVVVDPEGYILTNVHVVKDAQRIKVTLTDSESYEAERVGSDPATDLAVIKIKPKKPLIPARLGDADKAEVGSWVLAMGNPLGWEWSVSVGVISAKGRELPRPDEPYRSYHKIIQTDAAINRGNSGGPLVNINGEVIGIAQAIYSPVGLNIGLGFAIPIDKDTKDVIARLKRGETLARGQLGVMIEKVTPAIAEVYGAQKGVFVSDVIEGSPAAKAGVEPDDTIVKYDGKAVEDREQFVRMVEATKPGTRVALEVVRESKPLTLRVTVGSVEEEKITAKAEPAGKDRLGLTVEDVPSELGRQYGTDKGVIISDVDPVSDGARAGLQESDVIFKINRQPINDAADYKRVVSKLKKGGPVVIRLRRMDPERGKPGIFTAQVEALSE
jgi:serine protease Do